MWKGLPSLKLSSVVAGIDVYEGKYLFTGCPRESSNLKNYVRPFFLVGFKLYLTLVLCPVGSVARVFRGNMHEKNGQNKTGSQDEDQA